MNDNNDYSDNGKCTQCDSLTINGVGPCHETGCPIEAKERRDRELQETIDFNNE